MKEFQELAALVVGLGSMGKRRVRNLRALGVGRIIGWDTREDRRREATERYGIELADSFEAGMARRPDVLIISTPPHKHLEFAGAAVQANMHFFMEANSFLEGMAELAAALRGRSIVAAPSRTLGFVEGYQKVKELLDQGLLGPLAGFVHHCGHALPLWHPWEDYRDFYGGWPEAKGAGWDMIGFELCGLTYLFGDVAVLSAMYGKRAGFDTPIDDTFQLLLRFESGALGSSMIDVVSPHAYRTLRAVGEKGIIHYDFEERRVEFFSAETREWTRFEGQRGQVEPMYHAAEEYYIAELGTFLRAVTGEGEYPATFEDELTLMRLVEAVRESQESGRHISLER